MRHVTSYRPTPGDAPCVTDLPRVWRRGMWEWREQTGRDEQRSSARPERSLLKTESRRCESGWATRQNGIVTFSNSWMSICMCPGINAGLYPWARAHYHHPPIILLHNNLQTRGDRADRMKLCQQNTSRDSALLRKCWQVNNFYLSVCCCKVETNLAKISNFYNL